MRFATTIRMRPEPKFMNEFMDAHKKVCDASIQRGSMAQYLTYVVDEEIFFSQSRLQMRMPPKIFLLA